MTAAVRYLVDKLVMCAFWAFVACAVAFIAPFLLCLLLVAMALCAVAGVGMGLGMLLYAGREMYREIRS